MNKTLSKNVRKRLNKDVPGQDTNAIFNAIAENYVFARRARKLLLSTEQLTADDVIALELWWVSKLSKAVAGTFSFFAAVGFILLPGFFPGGEPTYIAILRIGGLTLAVVSTYFVAKKLLSVYLYHRRLPAMRAKYSGLR